MNDVLVRLTNVRKNFGSHQVLRGVNLDVQRGDVIAIVGASGSGKSTMLRTINGMESIDAGQIHIDETPLPTDPEALAQIRAKVGMVFQQFNLFPAMTVLENVTYGPMHVLHTPAETAVSQARELLARVGMEQAADQDSASLSGGQKQRVAIARALAMNPTVLLLDEPTSALDPEMVGEVLDVMAQLAAEGRTMVVVTHEMSFARRAANKIALLHEGTVAELTGPEEFFTTPRTAAGKEFISHFLREEN